MSITQAIIEVFRPPKKFKHVMVDIETLGLVPGSVILSVGAVKFDLGISRVQSREEIAQNAFYEVLSLESSIDDGFEVDGDTLKWWMRQSKEAQEEAFDVKGERSSLPYDVLQRLTSWFDKDAYIWGNGANYDVVLLESYYQKFGITPPWNFRNIRCFRTLKNTNSYDKALVSPCKIAHHALEDAIYQAQVLQAISIANPSLKF